MYLRLRQACLIGMAMLLTAASGQAALVTFYGHTQADTNSPAGLVGQQFNLDVTYTPTSSSATATMTSAVLTIGTETFFLRSSGTPFLRVVDGSSLVGGSSSEDGLQISARMNPTTNFPANDPDQLYHNLVGDYFGNVNIDPLRATEANVDLLTASHGPFNGLLTLGTAGQLTTVRLTGKAVPEPASVFLLSGLGLVAGRRVWRRRQQQKSESVA